MNNVIPMPRNLKQQQRLLLDIADAEQVMSLYKEVQGWLVRGYMPACREPTMDNPRPQADHFIPLDKDTRERLKLLLSSSEFLLNKILPNPNVLEVTQRDTHKTLSDLDLANRLVAIEQGARRQQVLTMPQRGPGLTSKAGPSPSLGDDTSAEVAALRELYSPAT